MGARVDARRARDRRTVDDRSDCATSDHAARRPADVSGGIAFGLATIVFALSQTVWLSVIALAAMGAADTVSVVVRVALVQLGDAGCDARPRGCRQLPLHQRLQPAWRVRERHGGGPARRDAGGSAGGIGTVAIALLWMRLLRVLREVDRSGMNAADL